jgi:general stress protein 26
MKTNPTQYKRIRQELKDVGMTNYGLLKLETDHLPNIIHENEHIKGVVYGRLESSLDSVMLVATDQRILFVDCKPFYKNSDEITYEVVAGIKLSTIGPFAGVVLHTRVKDYALRFVNIRCANIFTQYIENHIEKGVKHLDDTGSQPTKKFNYQPYKIPEKIKSSIESNTVLDTNTGVLSTVGANNEPHASVVHYINDKDENYYILTKTNTTKVKNIEQNNMVALTIHHTGSLRSLLIKGPAIKEQDSSIHDIVYNQISAPKNYIEGEKLPPITKIENGEYVVYKIVPSSSQLQDFSASSW